MLQVAILVGDLTYADNYHVDGRQRLLPPTTPYQETFQPRWDAWGRFTEPLAAKVPHAANHSVRQRN